MGQLFIIVFFIIMIVIMPKNNKEERRASHLLIDRYQIPVEKKKNPVRQMALLEKELGVSTYRASRKKTFILIGTFFSVLAMLGVLLFIFIKNDQPLLAVIVGLITFLVLIGGVIMMCIISARQASSLRTDAWAVILNKLDPAFPIEFLNDKKWQKAFLAQMENVDGELA
ncbi:TPA_asm: hypothetical protein GIN74_01010 [Listeria monocytogenes]|nr:hypothetical protein [Listeria monocytogenes]